MGIPIFFVMNTLRSPTTTTPLKHVVCIRKVTPVTIGIPMIPTER